MPGQPLGARSRRARGAYRKFPLDQFVGPPLEWACERGLDRRCLIFILFFILLYIFFYIFLKTEPAATETEIAALVSVQSAPATKMAALVSVRRTDEKRPHVGTSKTLHLSSRHSAAAARAGSDPVEHSRPDLRAPHGRARRDARRGHHPFQSEGAETLPWCARHRRGQPHSARTHRDAGQRINCEA